MQKVKLYENTDKFMDLFWDAVDDAEVSLVLNPKDVICVCTYEMDDLLLSDITIEKLVYAKRRGVKVYLILEDLNAHLSFRQVKRCDKAGIVMVYHKPIGLFYYYLL